MSTKPLLLAALLAALSTTAHAASSTFQVDLNTAGLSAVSGDSLSLEFQLNSGGGTSSNTASVSNFVFTGGNGIPGTVLNLDNATGQSSGDFASGFLMSTNPNYAPGVDLSAILPGSSSDWTGLADIAQDFDASVTDIKFNVTVSDWTTGTVPTGFIVDIFDNTTGDYLHTTDPNGNVSLVTIDLGRSQNTGELTTPPTVQTFTGTDVTLSATASVPEPSTYALFLIGGLVFHFMRRRVSV